MHDLFNVPMPVWQIPYAQLIHSSNKIVTNIPNIPILILKLLCCLALKLSLSNIPVSLLQSSNI